MQILQQADAFLYAQMATLLIHLLNHAAFNAIMTRIINFSLIHQLMFVLTIVQKVHSLISQHLLVLQNVPISI